MEKTILNFHFDYWNPRLLGERNNRTKNLVPEKQVAKHQWPELEVKQKIDTIKKSNKNQNIIWNLQET